MNFKYMIFISALWWKFPWCLWGKWYREWWIRSWEGIFTAESAQNSRLGSWGAERQILWTFIYYSGLDNISSILWDFFLMLRNTNLENNFAIFRGRWLSEIYTNVCKSLMRHFIMYLWQPLYFPIWLINLCSI